MRGVFPFLILGCILANNNGERQTYSPFEIENKILTVFHKIPKAAGMINYKGSKITEMEWVMESIGQTLRRENKYFLD